MMVYRSFVVGMLGAIALLIAMLPHELATRPPAPEREPEPMGIIHVSNSALMASPRPAEAVAELLAQVAGKRVVIVIDP